MASIIVTTGLGGVIVPWQDRLPADIEHFWDLTVEKIVIMDREFYESLPPEARPLPKRVHMILSPNPNYWHHSMRKPRPLSHQPCWVKQSLPEALQATRGVTSGIGVEVFIIGGAQVFAEALKLPEVDCIHLTQVDAYFEGDVFFPDPEDLCEWQLMEHPEVHKPDAHNAFTRSLKTYERMATAEAGGAT